MTEPLDDARGELLVCPFCGKPPAVEMTGFHLGGRTIRCETHECMGPHTTAACMDDAAIQWNTRAAPERCDAESGDVWESLEQIISIDQFERRSATKIDSAGNDYAIEMVDGPCAKIARKLLALVPPPSEAGRVVSDEDWQRALDCAHSVMEGYNSRQHISTEAGRRAALDDAMQHAFGILALSPDPGTVAVASAQYRCTCGAEPYCAPNVHAASCPLAISSTLRETP